MLLEAYWGTFNPAPALHGHTWHDQSVPSGTAVQLQYKIATNCCAEVRLGSGHWFPVPKKILLTTEKDSLKSTQEQVKN